MGLVHGPRASSMILRRPSLASAGSCHMIGRRRLAAPAITLDHSSGTQSTDVTTRLFRASTSASCFGWVPSNPHLPRESKTHNSKQILVSTPIATRLFSSKTGIDHDGHDKKEGRQANGTVSLAKNKLGKSMDFLDQVQRSLCEDILPQISAASKTVNNKNKNDSKKRSSEESTILLVAVSGGCDSMGLLHALLDISTPVAASHGEEKVQSGHHRRFHNGQRIELHVAHFDHCQRGEESQKDCSLVQNVCRQEGLPCHVYRWNDKAVDGLKINATVKFSQDVARQWRQSNLARLLQDLTLCDMKLTTAPPKNLIQGEKQKLVRRPGCIATAHHTGDSQETILLKLLRGVHVNNLSGITKVKHILMDHRGTSKDRDDESSQPNSCWVRPLLDLTKEQIRNYLEENGYDWREDASNQSNKYMRNRVRNELIPLMEDMMGGEAVLRKRLKNLEEQSREIRNDLSHRVSRFLEENEDSLGHFLIPNGMLNGHPLDLVTRQGLYEWAAKGTQNHQLSYDLLKQVSLQLTEYPNNRQWALPLGDGWQVTRLGDALKISKGGDQSKLKSPEGETASSSFQQTEESIPRVKWSYYDEAEAADARRGTLTVRVVVDRDFWFVRSTSGAGTSNVNDWRFTPPWRDGQSPLKLGNFLRGQKVPLHLRGSAPIICLQHAQQHNIERVESVLVAVMVNEKWIVDSNFINSGSHGDTLSGKRELIVLQLHGD